VDTLQYSHRRAFWVLHFTVFVWGFTAILGKLISLSALTLVFYRQGLSAVVLLFWIFAIRRRAPLSIVDTVRLLAVGALVGLHWVLFYSAIKITGVSVAVVCLSSASLAVALIEPWVYRRKLDWAEVGFGLLVIVGVLLLVNGEKSAKPLGVVCGICASLGSALFSTLNGKLMQRLDAARLSAYELSAGTLWVGLTLLFWPAQFVDPTQVSGTDWLWLLCLSVGCTVLPWIWSLEVIRTLSPFSLALATNLEPVYSIVLAFVLFPQDERLGLRFYVGTLLLVGLVLWHGVQKARVVASQ
jgi:drug/metabolite transporter (DMT)-like permease